MSRYYEMSVEIFGYDPAKVLQIQGAAKKQWPLEEFWFSSDEDPGEAEMQASGRHSLCGGESEEAFVERLSAAIWRANGHYCRVTVDAAYLENLPYETYTLDEADCARLVPDIDRRHPTDRRPNDGG